MSFSYLDADLMWYCVVGVCFYELLSAHPLFICHILPEVMTQQDIG